MLRLLTLLATLLALPASAEEVVAGLSQNRVAITANFDGSEILIFGAVKRFTPPPGETGPLEVIIAVSGPSVPVSVRRKERRAGIWVNADSVDFGAAPSFYAVATSAPWEEVITEPEDLKHFISVNRAIRSAGPPPTVPDAENFIDALIRIRTKSGLYQRLESHVSVEEETLFDTAVALPSNLTEGNYRVRIFLTRDGKVLDEFSEYLDVRKVGLERWIFSLANEKPLIYGLLSLFIAIVAGWSASAVFRYLRS